MREGLSLSHHQGERLLLRTDSAMKILISQPQPTTAKSPYFDLSEKYGVEVVFRPFIKVESLTAKEFRSQKVSILDHTAVVFTSRHAVDHFFELSKEMRIAIPDTMKYFCISDLVANYIQKYVQYRKRKVFFGDNGRVDGMMPSIIKHKDEKYFVPVSDVHTSELKNLLDQNGIFHSEAVMYRTVSNNFEPDELKGFDMMVFFSPAGVDSLKKNAPDFVQGDVVIGCFGDVTAKAVENAGLRLDIKAPSPGITSMAAAIDQFLAKKK